MAYIQKTIRVWFGSEVKVGVTHEDVKRVRTIYFPKEKARCLYPMGVTDYEMRKAFRTLFSVPEDTGIVWEASTNTTAI